MLSDTFTYTISDGNGGTDTATVTITVTGTNDAPVVSVINAGSATEDDAAQVIDLLSGQTDPDGDALSVSNITVQDNLGNLVLSPIMAMGRSRLTPSQYNSLAVGDSRTITVSYDVSDGTATTSNTATLVINGVN